MENQILIFRTSITKRRDIKLVGSLLAKFPQITRWNVDFEDRNSHIIATELE